jgi:O-methyltransferase
MNTNAMRSVSIWQKIQERIWPKIRNLPDCHDLFSVNSSLRYGYDSLAHHHRAEALISAVHYSVHCSVNGEIAEFGTHTGRTAKILAGAMRLFRVDKTLHLLDSFEGLPEATSQADKENDHVKCGVWSRGNLKGLSEAELLKSVESFGIQAVTWRGWFADTLPLLDGVKFSVVHLDCDLYQSTKDVLRILADKNILTDGAMLLFDDWDCHHASDMHGQRLAMHECAPLFRGRFEDIGNYSFACRRFIYHLSM